MVAKIKPGPKRQNAVPDRVSLCAMACLAFWAALTCLRDGA
ncbi:hypothetical protein CGRA01v4_12689 [Colletotrichum graminicola]|nr:hypothetical protein CGRA01v4_12689 [Colletotrichum graminicola]